MVTMAIRFLATHSVWIGLILRFLVAWLLPLLLDDGTLLPGVAYTDIDYLVYSDAADWIRQGGSPYQRKTYRYTPFLAAILAKLPRQGGRYLFCLADTLCGWMILRFRQAQRRATSTQGTLSSSSTQLQDALWWLYNPLAINICTRGSAESLIILLPVLTTLWILTFHPKTWSTAIVAGICHGVAVHAKLYPIIYSLSYAVALTPVVSATTTTTRRPDEGLVQLVVVWFRRSVQTPLPWIFAVASVTSFGALTYLAVQWYGPLAFEEGLVYHFSRVDHRHNYSMHWYWIYLARARSSDATHPNMAWMGRLLLVPQGLLLLYTSLVVTPSDLSFALFVQTFLFVTLNKVITAQYFTWYLCLLPLCRLVWTRRLQQALIVLGVSMAFWLGSAYGLEMQGRAVHRLVWVASVGFFAANVNLLSALLDGRRVMVSTKTKAG